MSAAVRLVLPPGVFRPPSDADLLATALGQHAPGADVLDLCTGSGVLAVTAGRTGARSVTAVDVSRLAVLAARLNGRLNGLRIDARRGDLYAPVTGERFDLIVANPPYIPAADDRLPSRGPDRALDAGRDGRLFVDRVIDGAREHLRPGGVLLLVHSSFNGIDRSLARLREAGLEADLAASRRGPLGPVVTGRAALLEERGLLAPGQREEELVILRGRQPRTRVSRLPAAVPAEPGR
jgi:release factor glutamine methyltransferase